MRVTEPVIRVPLREGGHGHAAGARLPQAVVVPIAPGVSAIAFDAAAGLGAGRGFGRLSGMLAGEPLPRPLVATQASLRRGDQRHVALVGRDASWLAVVSCRLDLDGAPAAGLNPDWLQSPLAEIVDLVDGLTPEGRQRLLRMFLTTAGSLYGNGKHPGFGAAVLELVDLLAGEALRPVAACAPWPGARIVSYRLPAGAAPAEIKTLIAVSKDRVAPWPSGSIHVEAGDKGDVLHILIAGPVGAAQLICAGSDSFVLQLPDDAETRPLAPWLARRPAGTRAWVEALLAAAAAENAQAEAALRELPQVDAPAPETIVRHLSITAGGMLALIEVSDPHGLVTGVRLGTEAGAVELDASATLRSGALLMGGFLPLPPGLRVGGDCVVRLVYGSGRVRTVASVRALAFDGAIPEGFARIDRATAVRALASARVSMSRRQVPATVEAIGAQARRPRLSLVAAAGGNADLLRARAAMLSGELGAQEVELLYHASVSQSDGVRRLLSQCHAVFGLGARLVVVPDHADATERLRAALHCARAPGCLVLGAQAAPQGAGWSALWATALGAARRPLMLGAAIVSADGAVRDAGGAVAVRGGGTVRLERRWVGLPANCLPGVDAAPTDRVTAEAVGLNAAAVAAFCGTHKHYPNPDVLLIDLARHRRRRRPGALTLLGGRVVWFGSEAAADPLEAEIDAEALALMRDGRTEEGAAQ